MIEILIGVVVILLLPFIVFVSAKLGVYGALVGRRQFEKNHPSEKEEGSDE